MGLFVAWIAFSIVAGVIASNKGRSSVGFFFLALVLSPILGIIAALIAKPDEKKIDKSKIAAGDSKKCPFCAEVIKAEAMVCRYCGRELAEAKEVDWIVKKYSQEEKKESTEPKDNKGTNFGIFFAILFTVDLSLISFAVPFAITPKIFGALTPTSTQKLTFLLFLIFFAFSVFVFVPT